MADDRLVRLVDGAEEVARHERSWHCHVIDVDVESWRNKDAALRRGKNRKPAKDD